MASPSARYILALMFGFMLVGQPLLAQDPASLVASAQAALLAGDYDAAMTAYASAASDPTLQCDALYGMASAALHAQRLDTVESALTQHVTTCGPSVRVLVMRGHTREQVGQPDAALNDYQQALTLEPNTPLQSYLYEHMAALDADNGVRYLRLAAEAERAPESKFALRQTLADLYLLLGSRALAAAAYDALLNDINAYITTLQSLDVEYDKAGTRRAELEFRLAQLEIESEQFERGYGRLQRIISDYPTTPFAFDALVKLVTSGQEVDIVSRMRINVLNENYNPVLGVVPDYLAANPAAPAELSLLLAQAQRGVGDLDAALTTLTTLLQIAPQDSIAPRAALELAQLYAARDESAQAVEAFGRVAASYPTSPEAPQALLQAAELARDALSFEQALPYYDQLGTQYPTSEEAQRGLFEAGLRLMNSNPTQAAALLGRVGTAEGFLWQGKLLQSSNPDAARAAWTQAAALEPGVYFGMRACALLNNFDPFALSGPIREMTVTPDDKAAAAAWVAQTFGLQNVSADIAPELANDPMLLRAQALWNGGWWREARLEFDTIHRLRRNDPTALLQLAFYYPSIGVYRSSLFAALRLMTLADVPLTRVPAGLARLAYPIYYEDLLIREAEANGLDPLLVAGLIRQESSFDATNMSAANARGLMQLIPATAADVARQKQWPDYQVGDLLQPPVNIAFGTHYLASVRDFQSGSIVAALLSYNAGPTVARTWVQAAGADTDQLHRVIAYEETRLYLEYIYENAIIYQQLYRGDVPACMFQPNP